MSELSSKPDEESDVEEQTFLPSKEKLSSTRIDEDSDDYDPYARLINEAEIQIEMNKTFKIFNRNAELSFSELSKGDEFNKNANATLVTGSDPELGVTDMSIIDECVNSHILSVISLKNMNKDLFDNRIFEDGEEMKEWIREKTGFFLTLRESTRKESRTYLSAVEEKIVLQKTTEFNEAVDEGYSNSLQIRAEEVCDTYINLSDLFCTDKELIEMKSPILKLGVFSIHDNYYRLCYQNFEFGQKVSTTVEDLKNIFKGKGMTKVLCIKFRLEIIAAARRAGEFEDTQ